MFKRKTKDSHSPDESYVSNFSDGELRAYGLTKVPGSVVQDDESLWDVKEPVALRLRKIVQPVGDRIRKSVRPDEDYYYDSGVSAESEPKERLDVRDVSSGKVDKLASATNIHGVADKKTRKADKSQQTCLTNLTRRTTTPRRGRRPNVTAAVPDSRKPRGPDVLPVSRIVYAVNVLIDRAIETYADFRNDKKRSRCCAIRVLAVLDKTICLVRTLIRLLEELNLANRSGDYACRYDRLVDEYDACRKTYLKIKKYVRGACTSN